MQGTAARTARQPTANDVIEFFRADYRLRSSIDPEVDGGEVLDRTTTVADWCAANDLVPTNRLAAYMDAWLGTTCGADAWRAVLEPADTRTLGDLSDFASAHAVWDDFSPVTVGGVLDAPSGVFFALRGMLAHAGVPVAELRPSTPVDVVARAHLYPLAQAVARLAPSLVPEPQLTRSILQRAGVALLGASIFALAWTIWHPSMRALGGVAVALLTGVSLSRTPFAAVKLGSYETFGDLARAIAAVRGGVSCA